MAGRLVFGVSLHLERGKPPDVNDLLPRAKLIFLAHEYLITYTTLINSSRRKCLLNKSPASVRRSIWAYLQCPKKVTGRASKVLHWCQFGSEVGFASHFWLRKKK